MKWERTFELAAPVEQVWKAFADHDELRRWAWPPGREAPRLDIAESRAPQYLSWTDDFVPGDRMTMEATFTETESGTRITLTRSGFGEGEDWLILNTSVLLGWSEGIRDLAAYLECGVLLSRHFEERSATGIVCREDAPGLRVVRTEPNSFGRPAGLREGDVVVRVAGGAVFQRSDLWLVQRLIEPGVVVELDFIRDGEVHSTSAPMSDISAWAQPGELGGATNPKQEVSS